MRGLICLVKQIAGGWLGIVTAGLMVSAAPAESATPVGHFWVQLLFPGLVVGLCLAFQTSRRDLPWAVAVSGFAYLGIMAGSSILDANLGNLVGTIVAVVIANLWARQTGRPTSIVLIPAIVMLVSGSIGFRGLASMAGGDVLLGVQQFSQMFVVAMTLVAGIMIGSPLSDRSPPCETHGSYKHYYVESNNEDSVDDENTHYDDANVALPVIHGHCPGL